MKDIDINEFYVVDYPEKLKRKIELLEVALEEEKVAKQCIQDTHQLTLETFSTIMRLLHALNMYYKRGKEPDGKLPILQDTLNEIITKWEQHEFVEGL